MYSNQGRAELVVVNRQTDRSIMTASFQTALVLWCCDRSPAVSFIKQVSLQAAWLLDAVLPQMNCSRGSAGQRPRLSSASCLAASTEMFSPLQTNQPKRGIISSPYATPNNMFASTRNWQDQSGTKTSYYT